MKRTTTTTGTALLIATMGLITFAQVTRAGGHGSGGGRSFGPSLGSINRGPGSFGGMQSSMNRGRGADDLANHNANDDRGRNRGPGALSTMKRGGVDDPANHDANDDRGRHHRQRGATTQTLSDSGRRGADDPANHDARDDRGRNRGPGKGGATPRPDDHGNDGVGHR